MTLATSLWDPEAREPGIAGAPSSEHCERRAPQPMNRATNRSMHAARNTVAAQADSPICPETWPAALYLGDIGSHCKVHSFGAPGARITMDGPPPIGAVVALKFPFTIYLRGRIAWRDGDDAEIAFDEPAQRSARLVEEVLLEHRTAA